MNKREIKTILTDYNSLAELDKIYQELVQKQKKQLKKRTLHIQNLM